QISNRLRTVRTPADLTGMRIRVLPSEVQARTFELLGAVPLRWDLTEAVAASVQYQRGLAEEEDVASRQAIVDQGCEIAELTAGEHGLFGNAVQPLWADAQKTYGKEMFAMVPR